MTAVASKPKPTSGTSYLRPDELVVISGRIQNCRITSVLSQPERQQYNATRQRAGLPSIDNDFTYLSILDAEIVPQQDEDEIGELTDEEFYIEEKFSWGRASATDPHHSPTALVNSPTARFRFENKGSRLPEICFIDPDGAYVPVVLDHELVPETRVVLVLESFLPKKFKNVTFALRRVILP